MKGTAINKEISSLYSLLTPEQKSSVVTLIKSFLKTDKRISRKQYNKELSAAEKRIEQGKFMTQEQLERESEKW
jgi:hypothetical protein